MKLLKRVALLSLFILFIVKGFAQDSANTDNSFMAQDGKIYVVMAVVVVIVLGLFIYIFSLDRKISKLEKKREIAKKISFNKNKCSLVFKIIKSFIWQTNIIIFF